MPKYRYNRYRDLEIDVSRLQFADDRESFLHVIRQEFDKWAGRLNHSRERFTAVMWYNVPKEVSRVVPWLIDSDPAIRMHHANANRIMFVRPHPSSHGSAQIPSYGTHYVKVECVVLEEGTVIIVPELIRCGIREFKITRENCLYELAEGADGQGEDRGRRPLQERLRFLRVG